MTRDRDPRPEAEKARAALLRNGAQGLAVPESSLESRPSVTPETFGEDARESRPQGVEAGPDRHTPTSGDEDVLSRGRE